MRKRASAFSAAVLLGAVAAAGQTQPSTTRATPTAPQARAATGLTIGDRAPELTIEKWLKGETITGFERGRVYVVEFWATWCGPCVSAIPHLTELQAQYKSKGVTVIGVTSEDPDNKLKDAERMVADKGPAMTYTVGWDTGRRTNDAWMTAANQTGIPTAFVVDKNGEIAFIGHPMWLDEPLEKIVAGTWDAQAGAARIRELQKMVSEVYRLGADEPKAALKVLAQVEEQTEYVPPSVLNLKFELLLRAEQYGDAYRLGDRLVYNAIKAKDTVTLKDIAWTIVDPLGTVKNKDLDVARKAAEAGCEISGWKDAAIIDALARVYFLKNDFKKAVEFQTKAVEASDPGFKEQLTETLEMYKKSLNK